MGKKLANTTPSSTKKNILSERSLAKLHAVGAPMALFKMVDYVGSLPAVDFKHRDLHMVVCLSFHVQPCKPPAATEFCLKANQLADCSQVELFSGQGALSAGFRNAGMKVLDTWPAASPRTQTYQQSGGDARKLSKELAFVCPRAEFDITRDPRENLLRTAGMLLAVRYAAGSATSVCVFKQDTKGLTEHGLLTMTPPNQDSSSSPRRTSLGRHSLLKLCVDISWEQQKIKDPAPRRQ